MKKAGSIIKKYFECRNTKGEEESLNYTGIWKSITGKNIERCTRPVAFKKGILFVEVEDSVWLYQLTLLKDKIIFDFNTISDDMKVNDIIFRNKGVSLTEKNIGKKNSYRHGKKDSYIQETKITEELNKSDVEEIENMVSFVSNLYQERLNRVISSFFRLQQWKRKKGAKKCTRCCSLFLKNGVNHGEDSLCHICRREKNSNSKG